MEKNILTFCSYTWKNFIEERKYILFNLTFFLRKEEKHFIFTLQLTFQMVNLVTIWYLIRMSLKNH